MKNIALPMLTVLLLAACASSDRDKAMTAVATPLHDLNLVKPDIPDILRKAERSTFVPPVDGSCASVYGEIAALDSALGQNGDETDSDEEGEDDKPSLLTRGKEEASKAAVKAIQNTAEEVVPFRKWVRKLTGAERRSKDLADAVAAGYARRSFLRGYAAAKACDQQIVAAPKAMPALTDGHSSASTQDSGLPALDWLAGHWCLQQGERKTEELWLLAQGNLQLGLSREIKADSTLSFEFIRIEAVAGTLTYLAQPGGREATAFKQVAAGDGWIRFENLQHDFPTRIEYRRTGDALTATISGPGKTGMEKQFSYPYQRCDG